MSNDPKRNASRAIRTGEQQSQPLKNDPPREAGSVFVPSDAAQERGSQRWRWIALFVVALAAVGAIAVMVAWPRLNPRRLDPVERVADSYLNALVADDAEAARRMATIDDPPAIRSVKSVVRDRRGDRVLKGSFARLGELHARIAANYDYDASAGRFTPKSAVGPAAETLDALHTAKDEAEKSGMYQKMQSGDPDDIFDAAEQLGQVFSKLAEGALAPKRIVPTYQMLVESSKPSLTGDARALALEVAASPKQWDALLKRPFHSLKPDGPFIFERAEVKATVSDRLASLGDPPSTLRLSLVRFRLEGIDTGWKVVTARRVQPGEKPESERLERETPVPQSSGSFATGRAPQAPPRSLHDAPASR
jgi:hypothetical protein